MKTHFFALPCLPLVVVAIAACGGAGADSSTSEEAIIGGETPAIDVRRGLAPVVEIGGCSGTKVGPRHFLTAAHCMLRLTNPGGGYALGPSEGDVVNVRSSAYADQADPHEFDESAQAVVDHVTFDYRWALACSIPGTSITADGQVGRMCMTTAFLLEATATYGNASDLALVVVRDLKRAPKSVRQMPSMPVSARRLAPGSAVTLGGFGCTGNDITTPSWLKPPPELHVGDTAVIGAPSDAVTLKDRYFFTDSSSVRVCPGDSGGPVLVERDGRWMVGGVHAGYSFVNGQQIANWHTRIDGEARILPQRRGVWPSQPNREDKPDVSLVDWLESEGVEVAR